MTNTHNFLPVNKKDMIERGWEQPDFVFITGDAYVDHPSLVRQLSAEFWKHMDIRSV